MQHRKVSACQRVLSWWLERGATCMAESLSAGLELRGTVTRLLWQQYILRTDPQCLTAWLLSLKTK